MKRIRIRMNICSKLCNVIRSKLCTYRKDIKNIISENSIIVYFDLGLQHAIDIMNEIHYTMVQAIPAVIHYLFSNPLRNVSCCSFEDHRYYSQSTV